MLNLSAESKNDRYTNYHDLDFPWFSSILSDERLLWNWSRSLRSKSIPVTVAYPEILFGGEGGGSTNSVEDRENGDLGALVP